MAAPTLVGVGSWSNTDSTNVAWPAGHQTNDIGILIVQTAAQSPATPAGWTLLASSSVGTAGAAGSTALWTYWKRATSGAESDAVVVNPGDHRRARIFALRGAETSGSPIHAQQPSGSLTVDTTATIDGLVTTVPECYVVQLVANATDTTSNQTTAGTWDNPSLTGFARLLTGNNTAGVGGGVDAGSGTKDVAGTVDDAVVTLATASAKAMLSIAIMPPQGVVGPDPVTEGGIYAATGAKAAAGATGNTTATLDTATVQARLTFALKPPAAPPANLPPVISAIPAVTGAVDSLVTFPIVYFDAEGDTVTFSLVAGDTGVPTGASVVEDQSSGQFSFEWTPDDTQAGEWSFNLRATDGTNTVDTPVSISVQESADTTLRALALGIANRAATDLESMRALADLLDEREQMNANVVRLVRGLIADAEESQAYMAEVIEEIESESEG